jgi:hypothetical protein
MKSLIFALAVLVTVRCFAATPPAGTLAPPPTPGGTSTVTWGGGPYTAVTYDTSLCTPLSCDDFFLTVNVPPIFYANNPAYEVRVGINWTTNISDVNDFDLYVFDAGGNLVNSSTQGNTNFELVDLLQIPSGTYRVHVVAFAAVNESYTGTATLGPAPTEAVRSARYKPGNFTFTAAKQLTAPNDLLFNSQDLEPRAAYDALGNIYVAAIQGMPAGTDVWKSMDGGATFSYLGEPDGAQIAAGMAARGLAFGGGDEDIAVGSTGNVYMASLWGPGDFLLTGAVVPLAATMCSSTNGGNVWVSNPYSQSTPIIDRQWIAAYKDNTVYLSFQQEGVGLLGGFAINSIFCLKSTDGGVTFPQVTEVTTPVLGVQPGFQGNIAVDQHNGNVYTVFAGHLSNELYVARSTDGGAHFTLKLVFAAPTGTSIANIFPILAVDRGSNVHVVFSDGTNVYLTSSSDQGATWNTPSRVNNGVETKTALSPWVDAGDAGKVDIQWWATSSGNSMASDAKWKVYFAQVQDALSKHPTILENAATGYFHTGPICVNGTGCAAGTRNLAEYGSTTVYLDGSALIVYPNDQVSSPPQTYFIRQTGGPTAAAPAAAPRQTHLQAAGESGNSAPPTFALGQNYPNPFNPTTVISYTLASSVHVSLKVYNVLGQEVATLVDRTESEGTKSVTLDASRLASGLYIYKLAAGSYIETKRMLLMK